MIIFDDTTRHPVRVRSAMAIDPLSTVAETGQLIVIIGLPRSGTTWIAKIFDSHPHTLYRHEPDSRGGLQLPFAPDARNGSHQSEVVRRFAASLVRLRDLRTAGKRPIFSKAYHLPFGYPVRRLSVVIAHLASRVSLPVAVPDCAQADASAVVVWKSIESTARLGMLARALPKAHFIHVLRHPCGYAASIFRGDAERRFTSRTPAWQDSGIFDQLSETATARHYDSTRRLAELSPAQRLAWLWAVQNEKALDDTEPLPNVTRLRYEDVCSSPLAASRAAFSKAGLAWSMETERFIVQSTRTDRSAYYAVFKDPQRAANAWRKQLPNSSVNEMFDILQPTRAWQWFDELPTAAGIQFGN
jgi:hypothetical protein